jgi:hypothetical protein
VSFGLGKPAMLTDGDRRLLIELCEKRIESLESTIPPLDVAMSRDEIAGDLRLIRFRIRYYRRLILKLSYHKQ